MDNSEKTGFNELGKDEKMASVGRSTKCCATGTCMTKGVDVSLKLDPKTKVSRAQSTIDTLG